MKQKELTERHIFALLAEDVRKSAAEALAEARKYQESDSYIERIQTKILDRLETAKKSDISQLAEKIKERVEEVFERWKRTRDYMRHTQNPLNAEALLEIQKEIDACFGDLLA